ncbi:transcription repressor OFP8-like [Cornus florida]|uniref:transcription repressor OFP8-like n=1 Tax=Cornus florida TaxID=4283 RepID=UPI00289FC3D5|nr:transcription repressor OFP8-like [Cornus florida]
MENNNSKKRVSRLFLPSWGCKTVSDIVKNSIIVTQNHQNAHHTQPLSSIRIPTHPSTIKTPQIKTPQIVRKQVMNETLPKQSNTKNSSSSDGAWFSSEEEETFQSLSSDANSRSRRLNLTTNSRKTPKPSRRRVSTRSSEMGRFAFDVSPIDVFGRHVSPRRETAKSQPKTRDAPRKTAKTRWGTEMGSSQLFQKSFREPADFYYGSCIRETTKSRRKTRGSGRGRSVVQYPVAVDGRVEESYAVVKTSGDPYSDFRVSMVEMIIERQILGFEDLEKLLDCFLSLNSSHHHKIIVRVFREICEALFSN